MDIFPDPLAADNPIFVLLFVHAKVAPIGELLNDVAAIELPLHTSMLLGTVTVGLVLNLTSTDFDVLHVADDEPFM